MVRKLTVEEVEVKRGHRVEFASVAAYPTDRLLVSHAPRLMLPFRSLRVVVVAFATVLVACGDPTKPIGRYLSADEAKPMIDHGQTCPITR